jgi:hypothetical protein
MSYCEKVLHSAGDYFRLPTLRREISSTGTMLWANLVRFFYMHCRRSKKWPPGLTLLILCLGVGPADANISVYPMTLVLNKQNVATLDIQSLSEEPSYIKITVRRILYAAGSVEPVEQDIQLYKDGVFAVPNRMVLPARGKRSVRFVADAAPGDYERSYRIYIETVPPIEDSNTKLDQSAQKTSLSVNVIWGALLFVPPADRKVSLLYENGILKNKGNTFLRVISAAVCSAPGGCKPEAFEVPSLPPLGQFDIRSLLTGRLSAKEITVTYEDRSSKKLHEIKIIP